MLTRSLFGACVGLLCAGPAIAQLMPTAHYAAGRYAQSANPYFYAPAHAPRLWANHAGSNWNSRPAAWNIGGQYNAYPWTGPGIFTGGVGAFGTRGYYTGIVFSGGYFGPRYYGYNWGYLLGLDSAYPDYYYGGWPYGSTNYNAWYPSLSTYATDLPVTAYAPPAAASNPAPAVPDNHAVIAVTVPFDATVSVQGAATKQSGENRTFVSPPLEPGRDYEYTVKAQWKVGDKSVEQSQTVTVRAGERSSVLFLSAG